MKKLAIISSHPIQYFSPLYRQISSMKDIEVRVFYGSKMGMGNEIDLEFNQKITWKVDLLSGINHEFLDTKIAFGRKEARFRYATNLKKRLAAFAPNAIFFNGYATFLELQTLLVAKSMGLPIIVRPEGNDRCLKRSKIKSMFRSFFLRRFYKYTDAFLSVGTLSTEHFLAHGGDSKKIVPCRYCVDNDYFIKSHHQLSKQDNLKSELGLERFKTIILFCGKLIEKKDPLTLLHAFEACKFDSSVGLVIVGSGALEDQLKTLAHHPNSQVHFAGFVNQDKIVQYYQVANVLVLGSQYGETWGLVVNEAMNFGVVPVVSNLVGCAPELVTAETGRIFNAGDRVALAAILQDLTSNPDLLKKLSQGSKDLIKHYDIQQAAIGFRKAVDLSTETSI